MDQVNRMFKDEIVNDGKTLKMKKLYSLLRVQLMKLLDSDTIDIMINLFNKIYRPGIIPKKWPSTLITSIALLKVFLR